MDKLYLLFKNDKDVREVVEIPLADRVQLIGVSRYTDFDESLPEGAPGRRGYQFNGAYPLLHDGNFNALYGKTMQLCDAMIGDPEQRQAFKSLMKESLSEWYGKETGYTFKMTEQIVTKK
jgi:hypothetical protein